MKQPSITNRKSKIASKILSWYRRHGRDLPWRNERNPYRVLVSEIMLQQTQVSRVLIKYPEFLKRFPTFHTLAKARTSDVIRTWQGMGYNNRAIRLHKLAKLVMEGRGGKLSDDIATLQQLPGIGRYTAHAVACFAFDEQIPVVDTNIIRVYSRLFPKKLMRLRHSGQKKSGQISKLKEYNSKHADREEVWNLAESLLPKRQAFNWNQALMDFGATVCTAANPKCSNCPLTVECPSAFRVNGRSSVKSRQEPGRGGIPNRIYRGRIIEVLRNLNGQRSMRLTTLGEKIKVNFSANDKRWLRQLAEGLKTDGLVTLKKSGGTIRIMLPE